MWSIVSSFAKTYNLKFEYVINNLAYINLIMYSQTLPTYDNNEKNKDEIVTTEDKHAWNDFIKNIKKHK